MEPYTRETVVERRQVAVHWSAIFAGALVAAGLWLLLQMLGTGIGLASIDTDDLGALRRAGIGTNAWSIVACLGALFAGGYVATRLSHTRDQKLAATHGLLTWAMTSVFGLVATVTAMSFLAAGVGHREAAHDPALSRDPVALEGDLDASLAPVNARQHDLGRPDVTVRQLVDSARGMDPDHFDYPTLGDRLAKASSLTRAESIDVWQRFGGSTGEVVDRANRLAAEQARVNRAAEQTGHAILAAGLALLLGLGGALLGSRVALTGFGKLTQRLHRHHRDREARREATRIEHTAPYPTVRDYPAMRDSRDW